MEYTKTESGPGVLLASSRLAQGDWATYSLPMLEALSGWWPMLDWRSVRVMGLFITGDNKALQAEPKRFQAVHQCQVYQPVGTTHLLHASWRLVFEWQSKSL